MTSETIGAALRHLEQHEAADLGRLDALLRIASISSDSTRSAEVQRAASWISAELTRIGFTNATVHQTPGNPLVTAEWLGAPASAPTVLVYCHYDVQPADPIEAWTTPPFEPVVRDGRLFARGATDDKGQLMMHLRAAEALLTTSGRLPINLRVLFEGEEEIGSRHLEGFLEGHRQLLAADLAIVTDGSMFARGVPSVGYGVRGLTYLELTVRGPRQDLHSGIFGGAVANPATVLSRLLASLHDGEGHVAVDGFYDAVQAISDEERSRIARLPFDEPRFLEQTGAPLLWGEAGYSTVERIWARPTLEINGLSGGFAGEGTKTIIPASASAKLSARLVPDQDPDEIARLIERHLRAHTPDSVTLDVRLLHAARGAVISLDHPAAAKAAEALEAAFDAPAIYQRHGGSIPAVAAISETLGLPTLMLGFGLPEANSHAPNEWLLLDAYRRGSEALVRLWVALGSDVP